MYQKNTSLAFKVLVPIALPFFGSGWEKYHHRFYQTAEVSIKKMDASEVENGG